MGEFEQSQEVYIFDFNGNLYDKEIRVELLDYLRPEKKFPNLEELIRAMDQDKVKGLALVQQYGPLER